MPAFFAFIKTKNRFKKCKKCCNLQGSGPVTSKKLRKYQRFGVQKLSKHRYLQCFVPSTFAWNWRNIVNTSIFCDQPAKHAVIYSFFCLAFKNTGICSVLCISGPKNTSIYSIFCVFAWLPPTTLKRKNVVIYSILWLPKSEKSSEKCVKTAFFSDFRTSKTHLQISPSFCPSQTPKNVKTPPG